LSRPRGPAALIQVNGHDKRDTPDHESHDRSPSSPDPSPARGEGSFVSRIRDFHINHCQAFCSSSSRKFPTASCLTSMQRRRERALAMASTWRIVAWPATMASSGIGSRACGLPAMMAICVAAVHNGIRSLTESLPGPLTASAAPTSAACG
jgi:hypothetical protein